MRFSVRRAYVNTNYVQLMSFLPNSKDICAWIKRISHYKRIPNVCFYVDLDTCRIRLRANTTQITSSVFRLQLMPSFWPSSIFYTYSLWLSSVHKILLCKYNTDNRQDSFYCTRFHSTVFYLPSSTKDGWTGVYFIYQPMTQRRRGRLWQCSVSRFTCLNTVTLNIWVCYL
jgi:hypothetical protein